MTGIEMIEKMSTTSFNLALFAFASVMKDAECLENMDITSETLAVGCQLILTDNHILYEATDAESLKKGVLESARESEQFAGMRYDEDEFRDEKDPEYCASDEGLAWCNFETLWNALNKAMETI